MNNRVLVVEDDLRTSDIICDYLKIEGFSYNRAYDGISALEIASKQPIDIIILDIMIPKLDGLSVCRKIREKSDVLIVILSARSDEDDKLQGFEYGADEYVTKPFSPKVLMARINALLKRNLSTNNLLSYGEISIDTDSYKVKVSDVEIDLMPKEYELILMLMQNAGRVLKRELIIEKIWGYKYFGDGRVVDTNIKTLRKKLGTASKSIKTAIGVGYKFEVEK